MGICKASWYRPVFSFFWLCIFGVWFGHHVPGLIEVKQDTTFERVLFEFLKASTELGFLDWVKWAYWRDNMSILQNMGAHTPWCKGLAVPSLYWTSRTQGRGTVPLLPPVFRTVMNNPRDSIFFTSDILLIPSIDVIKLQIRLLAIIWQSCVCPCCDKITFYENSKSGAGQTSKYRTKKSGWSHSSEQPVDYFLRLLLKK